MYKIYLKQAIYSLKKDKLFSIISIAGTALAITMIMVMVMIRELKTANIAPEINRSRTLTIETMIKHYTENTWNMSDLEYPVIKECIYPLTTPEYVSASSSQSSVVGMEGSKERVVKQVGLTDANFWHIFSFSFIDGKPFTKEEFASGIPVAVISNQAAKLLFRNEQAVGRTIIVNSTPYKIVGIVKDFSMLCKAANADVWIPYTSCTYKELGFSCHILAKHRRDFEKIKEEVLEKQKKFNNTQSDYTLDLNGPYTQAQLLLDIRKSSDAEEEIKANQRRTLLVLSLILLIPAINLSSFGFSRISKRMEEIGVRKAFGANRLKLLSQILCENMLSTLIGGLLGLLASLLVISCFKNYLFSAYKVKEGLTIPYGAFFSPMVFLYVFAACVLLNILSASIPAYRASRLPIINALKS